jgi:hypothetical protein
MAKLATFQPVDLPVSSDAFEGKTPEEVHQGGLVLVLAQNCNLCPSDCHLFSGLKKQINVRHFSSDTAVITTLGTVGRTKL